MKKQRQDRRVTSSPINNRIDNDKRKPPTPGIRVPAALRYSMWVFGTFYNPANTATLYTPILARVRIVDFSTKLCYNIPKFEPLGRERRGMGVW